MINEVMKSLRLVSLFIFVLLVNQRLKVGNSRPVKRTSDGMERKEFGCAASGALAEMI